MAKLNNLKEDQLISRIFRVRNMNVMLDEDLAKLYKVRTQRLTEQVRRNKNRFPKDFMFQLTLSEWSELHRKHFRSGWGGRRKAPLAFTEHGVLMLSSVLNSPRAAQVNIRIMRVYVTLNRLMSSNKGIYKRLQLLEDRVGAHDLDLHGLFEHLKQLISPPDTTLPRIGFRRKDEP